MSNLINHFYYEVAGDLLAKPAALTQLIEGSTVPATIVYCNTPSDTDLVEVLLKKRGILAKKLIGNISTDLAIKTMEQLANLELSTVIVTDIAAKNLDLSKFDQVISYSVPSDLETYQSRFDEKNNNQRLKTVSTLVGPNDIATFMQIKESLGTDIQIATLPTIEDIQKAKLGRLVNTAKNKNLLADSKYAFLTDSLLNEKTITKEEKEQVVAMLLHYYFEVSNSLKVASSAHEDEDYEDDYVQPNFNTNESRSKSHSRRSDKGSRSNGRRQSSTRRYELNEEASLQAAEAKARLQRKEFLPPLKEARIYIGKGKNSGLNESALKDLLQSKVGLRAEEIRRVIIRSDYVFFDVLDEKSSEVIDKLSSSDLLVKKATVISTQRTQSTLAEEDLSSEEISA